MYASDSANGNTVTGNVITEELYMYRAPRAAAAAASTVPRLVPTARLSLPGCHGGAHRRGQQYFHQQHRL